MKHAPESIVLKTQRGKSIPWLAQAMASTVVVLILLAVAAGIYLAGAGVGYEAGLSAGFDDGYAEGFAAGESSNYHGEKE